MTLPLFVTKNVLEVVKRARAYRDSGGRSIVRLEDFDTLLGKGFDHITDDEGISLRSILTSGRMIWSDMCVPDAMLDEIERLLSERPQV